MYIELTAYEARVIGCLLEKEITTPEQYPLSLNALTTACNQKSNRDPILDLEEATVQETVDGLMKKHLVTETTGFSRRVPKYRHRFCNTEFGALKLSEQELGVVCVLFLRGPQTPGELRARTNRLCRFGDVHEVESVLENLGSREDGPFVKRLQREPGRREHRYLHLFGSDSEPELVAENNALHEAPDTSRADRLDQLEELVTQLLEEVEALKHRVAEITRNKSTES